MSRFRHPAHWKIAEADGEVRPVPYLPPGYVLDESDPDFAILRRSDNSFLAAFSPMGATQEEILRAAEEDLLMRTA